MKTTLRFVLLLALLCFMGLRAFSQTLAGPFDFSTASQFTGNFVTTCTSGATLAVSSGKLVQTGAYTTVWVYDTTPDSTPTNATFSSFCVTAMFTPQSTNDSFGFLFYNGTNRASGSFLSVFNVNASGTDDTIRFFTGASMTSGGSGNQISNTQTLSSGGFTTGQSYSATLVVSPIGSSGAVASLIISDPTGVLANFVATQYLTDLGVTRGEIGFRSNKNTTGTTSFDDIAIRTPLAITILETSTTAATVSWPAYSGATSYKVYRDGVLLSSTTSLTYADSGSLDRFKSYEYQVIAYNSSGRVVTASPITIFAYRRFSFVVPWDDATTGTAADMSDWSTTSASQQVTTSNGHFYAGGQRIKFVGVNIACQSCFPSHNDPVLGDVAEKIAAHLAKLGINCVRLHAIDRPSPWGVFTTGRVALDSTQMDKFDYFISRLKAHGIYVDMNLHVYFGGDAYGLQQGVDLYDADMIQSQKTFASMMLTHTNPYTGNTYANEPAVALIEISNEDGLIYSWRNGLFNSSTTLSSTFLTELQTQWNAWLQTKYGTTATLATAWAPTSGQSYGTALITNGDFASGFTNPWYLQSISPVTATCSIIENGSPDGTKRALKVSVTNGSANDGWRGQVIYMPVNTTSVSAIQYTAKFWAKADAARTMVVGFQQNNPPYGMLGYTYAALTTEWRQYTIVIPVTAADSSARFCFSELGAQNGDTWFADISLQSGNTLLGGRSAWAEGQLGSEVLTNGTFSGSISPWYLQVSSPATASTQIITGGAPDGSNAAQINIAQSAGTDGYKVQLLSSANTYTDGMPYTISFQAKASSTRNMDVGLQQNHPNWGTLGYNSVTLTTDWQTFTVVIPATAPAPSTATDTASLVLGGLGTTTGSVWLANISVKQGVVNAGLPTGETLGTATILPTNCLLTRSRAAQQDWLAFLWQTEKNYWTGMKSYIQTTLGAKGLVIGSQTNYSPALVQADMDVVDVHNYWCSPSDVSGAPWYVENRSMAGDTKGGAFASAAVTRVPGKPFVCTEYNTPSPITYGGETLLLAAAYAALHDWDGIFIYGYEHSALATQLYFNGFFQIAQEPAKLLTFPVGASMMRKGTVATASNPVTATVTPETAIAMAGRSYWPSASDFGIPAKAALICPTGLQLGSTFSQVVVPYIAASTTELTSATNELTWDTNDKVVMVNTSKVKAVVGQTTTMSFTFSDGVSVTPGASMQPGNWCAISLMAKDGANFQSAGKVLITATGYTDNHKMQWISSQGPLDATSSVSIWGQAPTLMEGIDATIMLPAAYDKVTVWTLDPRGQHLAQVPVTSASGKASFVLSRNYLTAWYEVIIAP